MEEVEAEEEVEEEASMGISLPLPHLLQLTIHPSRKPDVKSLSLHVSRFVHPKQISNNLL